MKMKSEITVKQEKIDGDESDDNELDHDDDNEDYTEEVPVKQEETAEQILRSVYNESMDEHFPPITNLDESDVFGHEDKIKILQEIVGGQRIDISKFVNLILQSYIPSGKLFTNEANKRVCCSYMGKVWEDANVRKLFFKEAEWISGKRFLVLFSFQRIFLLQHFQNLAAPSKSLPF